MPWWGWLILVVVVLVLATVLLVVRSVRKGQERLMGGMFGKDGPFSGFGR